MKFKDVIGAYVLTVPTSGVFYVGSSEEIYERFKQHRYALSRNEHKNKILQEHWNLHRELSFEPFPQKTREDAYLLEKKMIDDNIDNELMVNIGLHVKGGDNLTRHPDKDDIIERTRQTNIKARSLMSPETRREVWGKFGDKNGMFGKKHTQEVRDAASRRNKGHSYNLGRKLSDDHKRAVSEFAKTRTGEKNPFYGRQHSEETKRKLSEQNKGILPPNTRSVIINGITYDSMTDAGRKLSIPTPTVLHRLKSNNPKFQGYVFAT